MYKSAKFSSGMSITNFSESIIFRLFFFRICFAMITFCASACVEVLVLEVRLEGGVFLGEESVMAIFKDFEVGCFCVEYAEFCWVDDWLDNAPDSTSFFFVGINRK